jgi:dienelactone hydrolase
VSGAFLATLLLALPAYWGDLDPGPFRAGFEHVEGFDYSRPYRTKATDPTERARPIHMSVWYPAPLETSSEDAAVAFRAYVGGADESRELTERLRSYGFGLSPPEVEEILSETTAGFENSPRSTGPFPLLLFGTGLTAPSYLNTVMCEYLATHGYVVVAIPSLPVREGQEADFDELAVDTQIRDMEFVLQALHDYPQADTRRLGLVAWSLGGVAQALLSMKNPDVAAVVSLDAATGYAYGQKLLESSLYFSPERATAPFLHATDSRESGQVPKSFRYFDEITRGPAYLLTIEGAAHAEFLSLASIVPRSVRLGRDSDETSKGVFRRYRLLCLYVRSFLDDAIKSDASAHEFLDVAPTRHGFEGLVLTRKR